MKKFFYTAIALLMIFNLSTPLYPKKEIQKRHYIKDDIEKVLPNRVMIRLKKEHARSKSDDILLGSGIISYEKALKESQRIDQRLRNKHAAFLSEHSEAEKIRSAEEPLLRTYFIEYHGNEDPFEFCRRLMEEDERVELAEPIYKNKMMYVPNDPLASQQTMLSRIRAFETWDSHEGDPSVVIGISDNGILQTHEDLEPNIAPNTGEIPDNGIDDDGNGYIDDYFGFNMSYELDGTTPDDTYHSISHGTEVAGIAAAMTNNGLGMAGVGNKCRFFPIKAAAKNESSINYGYQSIIYAALRGVDVLNCSWGVDKTPMEIEQSIIDFAVANDVAIVASGGNEGNSRITIYPAAYDNVLGVGEVTLSDELSNSSSLGIQLDVMAPGARNYATTNYGGYNMVSGGTSFSAPAVAGFLAIIRSIYPELNAVEAMEFARQCTDDIAEKTMFYGKIIPGRINLKKAIQLSPDEIPSIGISDVEYRNQNGDIVQRFSAGDEISMKLIAENYLAPAEDIIVELSVGFADDSEVITIIQPEVFLENVPGHSALEIDDFKIKINKESMRKILLRFDIYKQDGSYSDFRLWQLTPTSEVTTFSNDVFAFSVGDRGTLGYGGDLNNLVGVGISYLDYGRQIYEAGLLATESNQKFVSANWGDGPDYNDFGAIQPFINTNVGICRDLEPYPENKIGLKISQEVLIGEDTEPYGKINVTIENVSENILQDVAVGYFFDWDIGFESDSNTIAFLPEAIPNLFVDTPITAMIAEYTSDPNFPVFGCGVYSEDLDAEVQGATQSFDSWKQSTSYRVSTLNSGTSIKFDGMDDINCVVGMKYPGTLHYGEKKEFSLVFAAEMTKERLAEVMKNAFMTLDAEENVYNDEDISIYPIPARGNVFVDMKDISFNRAYLTLRTISGGNAIYKSVLEPDDEIHRINTSQLSAGVYFLQIITDINIFNKKIIITK